VLRRTKARSESDPSWAGGPATVLVVVLA